MPIEENDLELDDCRGSVDGPDCFEIFNAEISTIDKASKPIVYANVPNVGNTAREASSRLPVKPLSPAPSAATVFCGEDLISKCQRTYISLLWSELCEKIARRRLDQIDTTIRDEAEKVLKEMEKANMIDISPLKTLLENFFMHTANYKDSMSSVSKRLSEETQAQLLGDAHRRLQKVKAGIDEKAKTTQHLKEELASLKVQQQQVELMLLKQEKELIGLQACVPSLEEEISDIQNAVIRSDKDTESLEKTKDILERKQQELAYFKLFP